MRFDDRKKKATQLSVVKESNASKKLHVKMEHCFGIGELEHTFDFTKGNVMTVYAHNGVGKSSFCKAMELYAEGRTEEIVDELYGERQKIPDNDWTDFNSISAMICGHSEPRYTERFIPTQGTIEITDESGDVDQKCVKVFGRDFDRTFTADKMRKALWIEATFVPCNGMSNESHLISFGTKVFQQRFGMPVWFRTYEERKENGAEYKLLCDIETAKDKWEHPFSFEEFQKVASDGERRAVNFLYFLTQWNTWVSEQW